jgi:hypothetical protein
MISIAFKYSLLPKSALTVTSALSIERGGNVNGRFVIGVNGFVIGV